jgi:hypothetical protein
MLPDHTPPPNPQSTGFSEGKNPKWELTKKKNAGFHEFDRLRAAGLMPVYRILLRQQDPQEAIRRYTAEFSEPPEPRILAQNLRERFGEPNISHKNHGIWMFEEEGGPPNHTIVIDDGILQRNGLVCTLPISLDWIMTALKKLLPVSA